MMENPYLTLGEVQQILRQAVNHYPDVYMAVDWSDGKRPLEIVGNFSFDEESLFVFSRKVSNIINSDPLMYPINDMLGYNQQLDQILELMVYPDKVPAVYLGGLRIDSKPFLEPFNSVFQWGKEGTKNAGVLIFKTHFFQEFTLDEWLTLIYNF